ncbi:MAG: filamentous hemagglutinin N-terminal domain-containing protein, partial [Pseudomonadota bacterium]
MYHLFTSHGLGPDDSSRKLSLAAKAFYIAGQQWPSTHWRLLLNCRQPAIKVLLSLGLSLAVSAQIQAQVGVAPPALTELPTQGKVVAGEATITQQGAQMDITQTTQRGVIDWQTFNVGEQAKVNFNQPSTSSVTLNRVLGAQPSQIFGKITSNGQVFLTNSSGVYFSRTASVDVGALLATTHNISNDDLMSGNYEFNRDLATGSVVNEGELHASLNGYIALLAPEVRNEGVLVAQMGVVALASGEAISLNFDSNEHLTGVVVEPSTLKALIENKGAVYAPGGLIILSAKAVERFQGGVIKNSGSLEATGMTIKNGRIVLEATDLITQTESGKIDASGSEGGSISLHSNQDIILDGAIAAQGSEGQGGDVTLSADRIGLFGASAIDVSGATGGGEIFVGGGAHGQDATISNARQTVVGAGATLNADAINAGDGGEVIVWADQTTRFAGNISAQGGAISGDGGFVEVSGKAALAMTGQVDASAPMGMGGQLLLDPRNIIIETAGAAVLTAIDTFADDPSGDYTIDPNTIMAATNAGTAVTLQANNDITLNSSIVTSRVGTGGALTFQAGRSIILNATILSDSGNVSFTANDSAADANRIAATDAVFLNAGLVDAGAGTVSITMGTKDQSGSITVGQVTAQNLTIAHNGPTAGAISGAIDLAEITINSGLTINAGSSRNVTNIDGSVIVRGTTSINVGSGDVSLSRAETDLNIVGLTAGNVILNDTNAMRFAATTLTGSLTTTAQGPISSTGAVIVGGTTSIILSSGGFGYADPYISLTNAANDFQSGVTLSVASTGETGTGGYVIVRDVNGMNITSATTATYFTLTGGGPVNVTAATVGSAASITTTGAVDLGTVTVGNDLTVSTSGAITDSGTLIVPRYAYLTAGAANDITLNTAANNFTSVQVVSGKNVTLVDTNAIQFGNGASAISENLAVTAGGSISQYLEYQNSAPVTVGGTATFTATAAAMDLIWGPNQGNYGQGYRGAVNSITGAVTLATSGGSWRDIQLSNSNAAASVVSGSLAGLRDVLFYYSSAVTVDLPAMTLSGNLIVDVPSGNITQSGALVVDNSAGGAGYSTFHAGTTKDITLTNVANDFYRVNAFDVRDLSLVDLDGIALGDRGNYTFTVTRNMNVTAGGDITNYNLSGRYVNVAGTATFDAGANNIVLDTDVNTWGTVIITAANNVTLNPRYGVILGASTVGGTLYMNSRDGGALTQTGTVTAGSTTSFIDFTSGVTLSNANNVFGNLTMVNDGVITLRENDAITQASSWNTSTNAVTLTTSNDQAITLDQANLFGNLNLTQINSGAGSAGAVLVTETADSTYGMTQGSAWVIHGTTTLDSGAYLINLNNASNVFGPLRVSGATGSTNSVLSTVTIYAKEGASVDAITDVGGTGGWATGTGVVKLVAYDTLGTTAGGGDIILTNATNVMGDLYLKGTTVTITENGNITDGDSTSWNSAGNMGWVTTGTTNFIVANPTGKSIVLDNLSNQIGPVGITTSGTVGTLSGVTITDNTNLTQNAVWSVGTAPVSLDARTNQISLSSFNNILGPITITTGNGTPSSVSITEDDAITQGAVWPLTGVPVTLTALNNNAITLTTAANIMGALTLTGGAVTLTENDSITQSGAWTTTGTTTLNPTTNLITLTNANNVLGAIAIGGTPSAVSITENDNIIQASAWVQASTLFTLSAVGNSITLSQATNQLGDLTVTAQNFTLVEADAAGITDTNAWTIPGTTTLTAGSANPIVLNANPNSNFGTVSIISAANADIADTNGIILGASTIAASGVLTVSAGGLITQSGIITAPSLRLIGTGYATLTNVANNVQNLAAGFSGGDLVFTNDGDFAAAVISGTSGITVGANDATLTSATGTITGLANINGSTSSLTLTTGTALSIPQMTIAGAQSYTASTVSGSGITLTNGANSTAAGAINYYSPVTLAADLTIQSTNSDINFHGTVSGATNQLIINAGSGLVEFFDNVSALGSTGDAGNAMQLTSGGAFFDSTLAANNGLAVTGPVTFRDSVALADGNAATVFAGLVTLSNLAGLNLNGYDGMTFNNGVLLSGDASINSNNSTLGFQTAGTVAGPYNLTLNSGSALLNGLDRLGSDLTSLTVTALNPTIPSGGVSITGPQTYTATSGSILLSGLLTSTATGVITFNSPVVVGVSTTITTVNSNVIFGDTLDGNRDLTINSGTGINTFTGAVGAITPNGDGTGAALILQGSGAVTFGSTVQARSGITATGTVSFADDVTLTHFGAGSVGSTFTGLVTTGGADGNILSGYDGLTFTGGLTLVGGPVTIDSNGSTINFGAAVSGPQDLTLDSYLFVSVVGTGTVTGLQHIGFTSDITSLSMTGQTLSLPSTGIAVNGPMDFTALGGITLNGAVGNNTGIATGQIDFFSPVTLATGAVTITNNNAAINFASTINGAQALSLNNGAGATTFTGAIGGSTPLGSISSDATGTTIINGGSIATAGAQTYNDAVTLGAITTLTGVNVHFVDTVNGAYALTVNDSGTTTFSGVVGGVTPLASITTNAAGASTIGTTAITTSGAQTYNDAVTLSANTTFTGAPITFGGTVNGAFSLNASAGSSTLSFNAAVGGSTPLTSLVAAGNAIVANDITTSGTQAYTAAGSTTLNGDLATTNSNITMTGPVTVGANVLVTTNTGGGNITFSGPTSTINGAHDLTLTAGTGNVVLGGVVGGIAPLTAITITGNDLTIPVITTVGDLNQSYSALNDLTLNQSKSFSAAISFTADSDNNGVGSFILPNGVALAVSNNALTITAADLDLQGNSQLSSGSGLMTIIASNGRNLDVGGTDAAGQMTITGGELSRMSSSGGLDLKTTGAGWIHVNGITSGQSQNITGVLSLKAQGTGTIDFITATSTFNALTSNATGGVINIGVNLNTDGEPIVFVTPVNIVGASTINSDGDDITFLDTVLVSNDLTLTTGGGDLTFNADVGSNQRLVLNLDGGEVDGLDELQNTLTGLTVNSTSGISLPAFTINGPQIYNTGVIIVTGNLGGIGLEFNNVVNVSGSGISRTLDAGTGTLAFNDIGSFNANNLTLIGDEIDFTKAVTGSGSLLLQPSTSTRNVEVGGSGVLASVLNLTAADIAWLPIGTLGSLTFGSAIGTGTLDVAGIINAPGTPVTLNGGGGISQTGGAVNSGALTLRSDAGIVLANAANTLGAININGTPTVVNIADSTAITQGTAWLLGAAPLTLSSGAGTTNITLSQASNTFGTLVLTGAVVSVVEAASTDLGATSATSLSVQSTGAISTSGTVAVSGLADFKTLNNVGANITIANSSTLGSVNAVSRNAADSTNASGNISLALNSSALLKALATTGNITLQAGNGQILSQDGTSTLTATGLELLGAGVTHTLVLGANTITTLAGNTGVVSLVENSGFAIGTVNTVGLTTSGNTTFSTTGTVTESQLLAASGLELLGVGGIYTLTNTSNAITTLAGNTGVVSLVENSGFAIGTVNTVGLTTSGNTTLSTTGTVTESQAITAPGLELLGLGGTFTLTNTGNAITTLAGNTGVVSLIENSGFDIGTVNTVGLTTSGNTTFSTTGTVTESQLLAASGLELLGVGGIYTLTNTGNAITTLAGNTGVVSLVENSGFAIGTVNTVGLTTSGNTTLSTTGTVTESQAITAPGLELLGLGGTFTLTNTGNAITTLAGDTGVVSLVENSGFAIGTVNTVGLTTSGNTTLSTTGTVTESQLLAAAGLELLGVGGIYTLTNTGNAITTLAGDTGVVSLVENSGFAIGTVNTVGLTTSGNTTLSTTGNVTESQLLAATGLELLGVGGIYTLTNTGNAITTLAGNTGVVSLVENSGFAIGTVNTVGLTTSGDTTLSTTGTVTQAQMTAASGLELLGVGGIYTLTNTGNAITTLAGNTGVVSLIENSGFDIGTVNTVGLTTSGNTTFSTTGTVTESQLLAASGLELLGVGGIYTLTNTGNAITTLAGNTGVVSLVENSGFAIGTVNTVGLTTSGNTTLSTTGTVTESQAITAPGLELLGLGGTFTLTNTGNAITILAGDTGVVSLVENSGFAIGTVNTVGLTTSGNTTLSTTDTVTESQAITAPGLELLGLGGTFTLTNIGNAITTLAGDTGVVSLVENSGFAIGTVNTVGLTTTGNTTLSTTGIVTQAQAIVAAGLELLGVGGAYTFLNVANAITTLAGNTGALNFLENSGFAIGTVNTLGLTTSGNMTLSSTGTVTQAQAVLALGLELLGAGGTYIFNNVANAITTLAANTGVLSFLENSGFVIGTLNTVGVTTSGNTTLSTTGTVTQTQNLAAAGLELLGTGGAFSLARDTNTIPVLAGNTGSATVSTAAALSIGTVNSLGMTTSGNLSLKAGGVISQTLAGPLVVGDNLVLQTTHAAGDVAITHTVPSTTVLGESLIGGDFVLTATGTAVSQFVGSKIQVAGDLDIDAASLSLGGAGNLVQGLTSTPSVSELRVSGVINLGDVTEAGNYSVISIASSKAFAGAAIPGSAVLLNHSGNSVGGYIGVTTIAPAITVGSDVQTGITQAFGTTISIAGIASFNAEASSVGGSGLITLNNTGNSFGSLQLNGTTVAVTEDTGATVLDGATASTSFTMISSGAVTQTGPLITPLLAITATGPVTLTSPANDVNTIAINPTANAVAYTDANGFAIGTLAGITGINTGGASLTLVAGGSGNITQTSAITNVSTFSASAGGSIDIDQSGVSNTIATLGAVTAASGIEIADTAGLVINGNIQSTSGNISIRTSGGTLTLADTRTMTAGGTGDIYLVAGTGFDFINSDSTPLSPALVMGTGRFIIYSKNNSTIVKGGLLGSEFIGENYAVNGPATQGGRTGNLFLYDDTAILFFTANNLSRYYGDANPALTYTVTGYLAGDDATSTFSGTPVLGTAALTSDNVGNYNITSATGSLTSLKGYLLQFVDGTLAITPRPVDLTGTRVYDGTANVAAASLTLGALVGLETLSISGTGTVATKHVGTGKAITIGSLALVDGTGLASNYTFVGGTQTTNITAAPLTISTSNVTKAYNGTLAAVGTAVASSGTVFTGDSLSGGTFAFTNANAGSGNKTVTAASVTVVDGNSGNNYSVSYADNTTST